MRVQVTKPGGKENDARSQARQPQPAVQTPQPLGMAALIQLQRTHGNRDLQRMLNGGMLQRKCACGGSCPRCQEKRGIQTKLKISEPGDGYEQEANRVADQVMRMPEPAIQRQIEPEDEERIQRKALPSSVGIPSKSPAHVRNAIGSGGRPLDLQTRNFFEPRFGHDLSSIRIHNDQAAAESARAVNAKAYTLGNNIVFAARQYQPDTESGRHLIAHELTHASQSASSSTLRRDTLVRKPDDAGRELTAIDYEIEMLNSIPLGMGPEAAWVNMRLAGLYQQRAILTWQGAGAPLAGGGASKPKPQLDMPFIFRLLTAWEQAKNVLSQKIRDNDRSSGSSISRNLINIKDLAPPPQEVWKAGIYGGLFKNDEHDMVIELATEMAYASYDKRYSAAKFGRIYGDERYYESSGRRRDDDSEIWERGRKYGLFLPGEKAAVLNISAVGIVRAAVINDMAANVDPKSPQAAILIDEIHEFTKTDAVVLLGPEIERLLGPYGYTYSDEINSHYVADKINKAFAKYVPPGQVLGNPNATVAQRWDECQRRRGVGKNNLEAAQYDSLCFGSEADFEKELAAREKQARIEFEACEDKKGIKWPKLGRTHPEWIDCQNNVLAEYYPQNYAQLDADRTAIYQDMQVGMPAVTDQGFASAAAFHVAHELFGLSTQDSANIAAITSGLIGIADAKIQKVYVARNAGQSPATPQGMSPPPSNVAQAPKSDPISTPDRPGPTPAAPAPAAPAAATPTAGISSVTAATNVPVVTPASPGANAPAAPSSVIPPFPRIYITQGSASVPSSEPTTPSTASPAEPSVTANAAPSVANPAPTAPVRATADPMTMPGPVSVGSVANAPTTPSRATGAARTHDIDARLNAIARSGMSADLRGPTEQAIALIRRRAHGDQDTARLLLDELEAMLQARGVVIKGTDELFQEKQTLSGGRSDEFENRSTPDELDPLTGTLRFGPGDTENELVLFATVRFNGQNLAPPGTVFYQGRRLPGLGRPRGSSVPDQYVSGSRVPRRPPQSLEAKNYWIKDEGDAFQLVTDIAAQAMRRARALPKSARQQVVIDVRGQDVDRALLESIRSEIVRWTGGLIQAGDIHFLDDKSSW